MLAQAQQHVGADARGRGVSPPIGCWHARGGARHASGAEGSVCAPRLWATMGDRRGGGTVGGAARRALSRSLSISRASVRESECVRVRARERMHVRV